MDNSKVKSPCRYNHNESKLKKGEMYVGLIMGNEIAAVFSDASGSKTVTKCSLNCG